MGIFNIRLYSGKLMDKRRTNQLYIKIRFQYTPDGNLINVEAFHSYFINITNIDKQYSIKLLILQNIFNFVTIFCENTHIDTIFIHIKTTTSVHKLYFFSLQP